MEFKNLNLNLIKGELGYYTSFDVYSGYYSVWDYYYSVLSFNVSILCLLISTKVILKTGSSNAFFSHIIQQSSQTFQEVQMVTAKKRGEYMLKGEKKERRCKVSNVT